MMPKIRFEGFVDDWEQRKLGECFSERVESDPNGELISVTIGSGIKKFSELGRHDSSNDDKSKYKKVVVGDIAYNSMRMWQGASGYSPYNGIVSPAYTVITPFPEVDSKFFAYMFKREDMIHTFQIRSQGITSDNWNLKFPTLSEIPVMVPATIKEQEAIAACLTGIDHLITLHQRKCETLEKTKRYFLQNMFPQKGEKVPKVRLKGFTDEWKSWTLGELYTERNERGNDSLQILSVSIHSGISDEQLDEEELGKTVRRSEDKSTYKHVYPGDLIFNMMRAWQGAIGTTKSEGMISPAYISAIPSADVYPMFMNYLLRRKEAIGQINNLSYGLSS